MPLYSCLNMGASILFVLNSELGSALCDIVGKIHRQIVPQNSLDLYWHKAGDCGIGRDRTQCS